MGQLTTKLVDLFKAISCLPGREWGRTDDRIMFVDSVHLVPAEAGRDLREFEALRRAPSGEEGRGAGGDGDTQTFDDIARVLHHAAEIRDLLEHPTLRALLRVLEERERQVVEEGFNTDHDDGHKPYELLYASAWYTLAASEIPNFQSAQKPPVLSISAGPASYSLHWPWEASWYKPKGQRRDLERAVALGLAALEKQDRDAEYAEFKTLPVNEVRQMTQEILAAAGYKGAVTSKGFKEAMKAAQRGILRIERSK